MNVMLTLAEVLVLSFANEPAYTDLPPRPRLSKQTAYYNIFTDNYRNITRLIETTWIEYCALRTHEQKKFAVRQLGGGCNSTA